AWKEALECEAGGPLEPAFRNHAAWKGFLPSVSEMWVALPDRAGRWAALGGCVYHPQWGQEEEGTRIPRLDDLPSKVRDDAPLQGRGVTLTEAAYERWLTSDQTCRDPRYTSYRLWLCDQVGQLHNELLRRLADTTPESGDAVETARTGGSSDDLTGQLSKE